MKQWPQAGAFVASNSLRGKDLRRLAARCHYDSRPLFPSTGLGIRLTSPAMRYALRQKFWSFGEDFTIHDEEGRGCYIVDGRVFSFGDKLSIHDMAGNLVACIEQRLLTWGPKYEIYRPGKGMVEVAKEHFTFFYCKFTVDGPGGEEDYEADGDFFDHEYRLKWSGQTVGRVSKEWFTFSDSYGIEIADSEDPVLLLAIAVVIDLVCHEEKSD